MARQEIPAASGKGCQGLPSSLGNIAPSCNQARASYHSGRWSFPFAKRWERSLPTRLDGCYSFILSGAPKATCGPHQGVVSSPESLPNRPFRGSCKKRLDCSTPRSVHRYGPGPTLHVPASVQRTAGDLLLGSRPRTERTTRILGRRTPCGGVTGSRWWTSTELKNSKTTRFAPGKLPELYESLLIAGPPEEPIDTGE